ncbi:hypothetical protein HDU76_005996 [Blyttiomyces sp. JEL0837]|nr:hypothetical protein HDU76_005996 [Blyttiomyces sp. JEL0837]
MTTFLKRELSHLIGNTILDALDRIDETLTSAKVPLLNQFKSSTAAVTDVSRDNVLGKGTAAAVKVMTAARAVKKAKPSGIAKAASQKLPSMIRNVMMSEEEGIGGMLAEGAKHVRRGMGEGEGAMEGGKGERHHGKKKKKVKAPVEEESEDQHESEQEDMGRKRRSGQNGDASMSGGNAIMGEVIRKVWESLITAKASPMAA